MDVFVRITGQEDNIGDVVLRRALLAAARPLGRLHLHVGRASDEFLRELLTGDEVTYRDYPAWHDALRVRAAAGPVILIEKPGELQLTEPLVRAQLRQRLLLRRIARSGGRSLLLGVGARHALTLRQRLALRVGLGGYDLVKWRDVRTGGELGFGGVMPDWAFGEAPFVTETRPRDLLAVSLRIDRPFPSDAWIEAVRAYAAREGLDIVAVTQVGRDLPRSQELAERLGGTAPAWTDGDHYAAERMLRDLYSRTRIVVSDRLHVLIVASIEGAVPLCLVEFSEEKIGRHFEAIGLPGVTVEAPGRSAAELDAIIAHQAGRHDEVAARVREARRAIDALGREIDAVIGRSGG